MKIEIDQSWKIEKTNKTTVLAFSNSKNGVVILKSKEKKLVQKYFREIGKPRLFTHLCFAALIFILIKNKISNGDQIFIDKEYPGYDKFINQKIHEFIQEGTNYKNINFYTANIGKKSNAHIIAIETFNLKDKSKVRNVTAKEIIAIIKKNFRFK